MTVTLYLMAKPHICMRQGVWFVFEDERPIAKRYTFRAACIFALLRIGPQSKE